MMPLSPPVPTDLVGKVANLWSGRSPLLREMTGSASPGLFGVEGWVAPGRRRHASNPNEAGAAQGIGQEGFHQSLLAPKGLLRSAKRSRKELLDQRLIRSTVQLRFPAFFSSARPQTL